MPAHIVPPIRETANDRLKRRFAGIWWNSIIAAVVVHFLLFAFFPEMTAAVVAGRDDPTKVVIVPSDIPDPPAAEDIIRPANPIASVDVSDDVSIGKTVFDSSRPVEVTPPDRILDPSDNPDVWTPRTVEPRLRNLHEVQRALVRLYPAMLRDAGIGGQTIVWFYIDETGRVVQTRVRHPSEHRAFDEAALKVAELMRFAPAYNRERPVAVWVALPIRFTAR
jgi:TonB family protein